MIYYIVDDDPAVCSILHNLIENDLNSKVAGIENDGANISARMLNNLKVDILLIDLLMPKRDGIDTLEAVYPEFRGKTVMLSQVETKEMIASAYKRNIEAYITKPINNLEVTSVLRRIEKNIQLEKSVYQIKSSLLKCDIIFSEHQQETYHENCCDIAEEVLTDLGICYEKGAEDLIVLMQILNERKIKSLPPLKEMWRMITSHQQNGTYSEKDVKATEQRIRRAIQQSFMHICALGALDITHPKFEHYAMKFFDLDQVQQKIFEINSTSVDKKKQSSPRLNIRRFISALYDECKSEQ